MATFTDWAADQFKKDAERMGHMPLLLKSLREESDEQWTERVMPIMDQLHMSFVMSTAQCLISNYPDKEAVAIFNKLKETLTPEVPRSSEILEKP